MEFLGRNADLGAEPELAAVGEGRRDVDVDARRIDPPGELPGRPGVFGDDGFAVARGVAGDVGERLVERGDRADRKAQGEKLRPEARCVGRTQQRCGLVSVQRRPCRFVGLLPGWVLRRFFLRPAG